MPRLGQDTMETGIIGRTGFGFTGTRIEHLSATSYTLATIIIDASGSVTHFAKQLDEMLRTVIEACKKSPRSDNILVRTLTFNTSYYQTNGINEIHGFKPLADIDVTVDYPQILPAGGTPLFDATFSAIGATTTYGKQLRDLDYTVNGIAFIVTDGMDTGGTATPTMIKNEMDKVVVGEELESMVSILIGINTTSARSYLDKFKDEAGLTTFIDAGNATSETIAKIGGFVAQSISSQSQSLGSGGPSQQIAAVI